MAKRDCPIVLDKCPGADSPITNASSEAPDPVLFAGVGWPIFDPYKPPPLGDGPDDPRNCYNITWTGTSQELADFLAYINALYCPPPPPPPPPPPNPPPSVPEAFNPPFFWTPPTVQFQEPTREFTNDRQFAQVSCPNGAIFEMAVEAGTVIGGPFPEAVGLAWVEYINAYLLAWILSQLYAQRVCVDIPGLNNRTPPGTPPPPPPPPGGPPTPVGSNPAWCCLGSSLDPAQNTYTISGSSADWTFDLAAGSLAPGTVLTQTGPRTAVVSGTPAAPGTYTYTISATSGSMTITVADTLHVFGLVTSDLPEATVDIFYDEQLEGSGGTPPYTFSGTPPAGLTLDSDGRIHGTPTTADP